MSTLTGLISGGGGGSVIKSIQRGYRTAEFSSTTSNTTISSVDLSKSFLIFSSATGTGATREDWSDFRGSFTSDTNIQFYRYQYNTSSSLSRCYIAWEVVEYV